MKLLNNKGFTLVEVVVTTAILSIICLMFIMITTGAFGLYQRGTDLKNQGTEAQAILENVDNDVNGNPDIIINEGILEFGNDAANKVSVNGSYKTVTVEDVTFSIFDSYVGHEENVTP